MKILKQLQSTKRKTKNFIMIILIFKGKIFIKPINKFEKIS